MTASHPRYIVIGGATATGKSTLALECAEAFGGEIVNADSVQVYRGLEIGAAKASAEERARVPHHLLDVADLTDDYDAARFAADAKRVIHEIAARGKWPIVVGGTGLYLRALAGTRFHDLPHDETLRAELNERESTDLTAELQQRDPERAAQLHPNDRVRIVRALEIAILTGKPTQELWKLEESEASFKPFCEVVIDRPRAELLTRIEERSRAMLAAGLVAEVKGLLTAGAVPNCKALRSIGYREVVAMLSDELAESDLLEAIVVATRRYAKRQRTWFRRYNSASLMPPEEARAVLTRTLTEASRERP